MREGRKLPSAEMSRKKEHSLPTSVSTLVVLKSLINDNFVDVLWIVFRKPAQFGELPPKGRELSAQDLLALALTFLGKGHLQVAHSNLAQPKVKQVDQLGDTDGEPASQRSRQNAHDLQERPRSRIFKFAPHSGKK